MEELKSLYPLYPVKLSIADLYSVTRSGIDYALPVKDSMSDVNESCFNPA